MGLSTKNLGLTLGKQRALDDVSAAFPKAALSVVVGPNGAGKSSLLRVLAGLASSHEGHALIDGEDLASLDRLSRARRIAYLPQDPAVHWDVRVRDVVMLGRHPHRDPLSPPAEADRAACERAMALTDSAQFADRKVMELSGGERARVMIARLVAGEPEWILADEPLASLDPRHRIGIMALLSNLAKSGTGVIAVLHDLAEARRWADHALLLDAGRVVKEGKTADVMIPRVLAPVFGTPMAEATAPDGSHHLVIG